MSLIKLAWEIIDHVILQNLGGWAALITSITAFRLKDAAQIWLKSSLYIRRAAETERAFNSSFKFADALLMLTDTWVNQGEAANPDEFFEKRFDLIKPEIEETCETSISARLFLPPEIWEQHQSLMNQWPEIRAAFYSWQASRQAGSAMSQSSVRHYEKFMGQDRRDTIKAFKNRLADLSRPIVTFEKSTLNL